jgi:hypothetical protein
VFEFAVAVNAPFDEAMLKPDTVPLPVLAAKRKLAEEALSTVSPVGVDSPLAEPNSVSTPVTVLKE